MFLTKAVYMTPLPVLKLSLDHDYFSSMCRMRTVWKMSANRSSNGGQNGAINQTPNERVMMVFDFIHHLIAMRHSFFSPAIREFYVFACFIHWFPFS